MAALRIDYRDKLIALTAALTGFSPQEVSASKLDTVDATPCGSVYLKEVGNEPGASRGNMSRSLDINVSLFIDDAGGAAEAKLSGLVNNLEKAVETARRAKEFTDCTGVHMSAVQIVNDPTSKGKRADAHITFSFTFAEHIL